MDPSSLQHLRARYGAELLLVRLDQHVAWRGDAIDAPGTLLARVIGGNVRARRPVSVGTPGTN